jgi:hypothetical protein
MFIAFRHMSNGRSVRSAMYHARYTSLLRSELLAGGSKL